MNIHHFVVSSLLAHAVLLAAWAGVQSRHLMIPATEASAPVLHVSLQALHNHSHTRPPQHRTRHPIQQRQEASSRPHLASNRAAGTGRVSPTEQSSPPVAVAQTSHPAEVHRSEIRDRVLSRIRTDLRQYFVYPLLAQRQGWQGRVILAFSVEADGAIRNIHVAAGSGYAILDASAVNALTRVRQLYPYGDGIQGESLNMQLPVIFQLQGG